MKLSLTLLLIQLIVGTSYVIVYDKGEPMSYLGAFLTYGLSIALFILFLLGY